MVLMQVDHKIGLLVHLATAPGGAGVSSAERAGPTTNVNQMG